MLLEMLLDRSIKSREKPILLLTARVWKGPAVEDESTPMLVGVAGIPTLVAEAGEAYTQRV
jgi:hypothetical protein